MSNSDDNVPFDLQFTPNWARQSPDAHHERMVRSDRNQEDWEDKRRPRRDHDTDGPRREHRRDDRRPRRDDGPRPPRDREHFKRDDRPPREDRPPRQDRPPREQRQEQPPREREHFVRRDEQPPRPAFEPLPVEVRFLPDPRALGSIMRKIQTTHLAYPLRDMARLFLENLSACMVRVAAPKDQPPMTFWTCKHCGVPALTEEEIRQHFIAKHFDDFFEAVTVENEPPSGNFTCVAKCGVTGILLGPPNHHSYATKVQEILRGRCAGMNPDTYRSRIIMAREPEAIEEWRKEAAIRTLYRLKAETVAQPQSPQPQPSQPSGDSSAPPPAEPAEAAETPDAQTGDTQPPAISHQPSPETPMLEYAVAESMFLNDILPKKIGHANHFTCMAEAARQTPGARLNHTLREAFYREIRHPSSLFYALRGAFHYRKMHVFRTNNAKGADFVSKTVPARLETTDTVAEIRDILTYVAEHPGCPRAELLQAVTKNAPDNVNHIISQLLWLIERGNLIEYYNGTLALPALPGEFPVFRYLPGERDSSARLHGETKPGEKPATNEKAADASSPIAEESPAEPQPPEESIEPVEPIEEPAQSSQDSLSSQ